MEGRFDDHLVEAGRVRATQPARVGVAGEADDRDVRVDVRNLLRVDPGDVADHEVGRADAVGRDQMVLGKKRFQLASEEEVDACQQDRRHAGSVPLRVGISQPFVSLADMADRYVTVARVDEVPPGSVRMVRAGDEEIALAHVDGEFYATQGRCLHLKGPLGEGRVDDHVLTCPWHGWQYDLRTGENEFDRAIRLQTYEVRVEDGNVQVAL